jgi:uncharacterized repeat protein (TIGR02543 family)
MIIKCYKLLSNWLSWVVLILMIGTSPIIQAATDCDAVTEISKGECESLLELYNSTDGVNWKDNTGWNVTNTPCSWFGVTCSNGGVSTIELRENKLSGSIPNFSTLPNLEYLYLYSNKLSGSIPDFSALPNLTSLSLSTNQLSGSIPNFRALPNLTDLSLGSNQLSGSIPDFSALPNLTDLSLGSNQLSGSIPDFSALPNLKYLSLYSNKLSGSIPDFSALPNLTSLDLFSNQLSGSIPDFSALPNLTSLDLSSNQLSSNIPDFSALPNLEYLSLSTNQLSGTIPNFSALPNLTSLDLFSNQLSGSIPDFSALPNLEQLNIHSNNQLCKDKNTNYAKWQTKVNQYPNCSHNLSTSSGNGGTVSPSPNKDSYNDGEIVELTATPEQCYKFTGWSGDCSGTSSTCELTMNSDKSVTANFQLQTYELTIQTQGGKVTSNNKVPDSNYNCGSEVTLKAVPDTGYNFVRWEGDASGNDPVITLTMDSNKTIKPIFKELKPVLNIPKIEGGSVNPDPNNQDGIYNYGDKVNLTANPEQCYNFIDWGGDCSDNTTSTFCQLTMDSDKYVTANFQLKSYDLVISKTQGGKVTSENIVVSYGNYYCGTKVTLKAVPDNGYSFVHWEGYSTTGSILLSTTGVMDTITVTMDSNKSIKPIFKEELKPVLNIPKIEGGSVNPDPNNQDGIYNYGDKVNLTANPEQCYNFIDWGGDDCTGTNPSCQLTMDGDKSVTANFEIKSFKLNISSDNGNVEHQPNKTLYNCGQTVKLTAKPNQGYKFKAWNGDANGSDESITINMESNKNITAIFEPVTSQPTTSTNEKYAIIIAASGAHKQNSLFPYSNDLALRMYRTLFSRNYTHENIIYMNPQKWQDLHGSGRDAKIVDYELFQPQPELEQAFNTAANATKQFIFYIHGHAQKDSLQINREYWLPANQLQQLLNKIPAEQIIIIDTCYSGSFIDDISGTKRTILTSSDAESRAWNNSNFSDTLIPALRRGNDIKTAFLTAVAEIETKQVPQLDDDGDGVYSSRDGINAAQQYINQQGISQTDAPQILQIHDYISLPAEQARAVLWIKTAPSGEAIKKARATLIPPGLQSVEYQGEQTNFGRTQIEMLYNQAQDRYEAVYKNFRQPGEWKIKYQVQGNQGFWSDTVTGIVQAEGVSTPVTIQISFNKPSYQIGEQLRINITTNGIEEQKNYDLYLAIIYPQGFYQTITYPLSLSPVDARQAYKSELNLSGEQNFSILDFDIPTGWKKGKYLGCGVIMTTKGDPWQSTNWISFDCEGFNLR